MISNSLGAVFQSLLSGGMSNALGASQYSNPQIAAISQQSQSVGSTNEQAAQVMQQTIQDMKSGKISKPQALDVYEQLRAAGAAGGAFSTMDKIFGGASRQRADNHSEFIGQDINMGMARFGEEAMRPIVSSEAPKKMIDYINTGSNISF